jgi:hypothetical protein
VSRLVLILVVIATLAAAALTVGQAGARPDGAGVPCRPATATAPGHPGAAPGHPAFARTDCGDQE